MRSVSIRLNFGDRLFLEECHYALYYVDTPDGHHYGNETALLVQDAYRQDIKGQVMFPYTTYTYNMDSNNFLGSLNPHIPREVILVFTVPGSKYSIGIKDFIACDRNTVFNCQKEIDYLIRE